MAKALKTREPTYRLPGAKVVLQHGRFLTSKRGQIASIAGEISQEVRDRKEKANVHPQAMALALKLLNMGNNNGPKLREFLAHFDAYRDDMKLDDLSKTQGDFVADEKEAETTAKKAAAKVKPKAANSNAKKKPSASQATRQAGAASDNALKESVAKAEAAAAAEAALKAEKSAEAGRADLH